MSALMEPSTTTKFLLPLVLTPVTVFTSAAALPTMERPGSRIMVRPRSATRSRTLPTKSAGLGNRSPLQQACSTDALLTLPTAHPPLTPVHSHLPAHAKAERPHAVAAHLVVNSLRQQP